MIPSSRWKDGRIIRVPRVHKSLMALLLLCVSAAALVAQNPAPAGGATAGAGGVPTGQTGGGQISLPPVQSSMQTAPGVTASNAAADAVLYPGEDFRLGSGDLISVRLFLVQDYLATVRLDEKGGKEHGRKGDQSGFGEQTAGNADRIALRDEIIGQP